MPPSDPGHQPEKTKTTGPEDYGRLYRGRVSGPVTVQASSARRDLHVSPIGPSISWPGSSAGKPPAALISDYRRAA